MKNKFNNILIILLVCFGANGVLAQSTSDTLRAQVDILEMENAMLRIALDQCKRQCLAGVEENAQITNLENRLKKIKEAHARDITTMLELRRTKAALDAHIAKLDAEIAQLRSDSSGLAEALEGMTTTMKMYMELYTNEVEAKIKATKDFQEQLIKETMVLHTPKQYVVVAPGSVNKLNMIASSVLLLRKEPIYLSFKSKAQGAPRIQNTTYTIKKNGRVLDGAQQIEFSGESDIRLPDALNRNLEANAQFVIEVEYEVDDEQRKVVYDFRVD